MQIINASIRELMMQRLEEKKKSYFRSKMGTWRIYSIFMLQPAEYFVAIVNRYSDIHNQLNRNRCLIPINLNIMLGSQRFCLQANHHRPSWTYVYIKFHNCCYRDCITRTQGMGNDLLPCSNVTYFPSYIIHDEVSEYFIHVVYNYQTRRRC